MRRPDLKWKSVLFGAAIASALSFGAAQAFASPPAPAGDKDACSQRSCPECGSLGGTWVPMYGRCLCCG